MLEISDNIRQFVDAAESDCAEAFSRLDAI